MHSCHLLNIRRLLVAARRFAILKCDFCCYTQVTDHNSLVLGDIVDSVRVVDIEFQYGRRLVPGNPPILSFFAGGI